MSEKMKAVHLKNKQKLYAASWQADYSQHLVLPESAYALLHHLFGYAYSVKIFLRFKQWRLHSRDPTVLTALLEQVRERLAGVPIPRTRYQQQYRAIKKRVFRLIQHIKDSLSGRQGTPHKWRHIRNRVRQEIPWWGDYLSEMTHRGNKFQH